MFPEFREVVAEASESSGPHRRRPETMSFVLILYGGGAERAYGGRGDAAAVVLPALVHLAKDLGEAELLEEADHGPRGIELAAEGGELRGGWSGVMVVV